MPAGLPMQQWRPFLSSLKTLAPLISATRQLKLPLTEHLPEQLSTILRQLRGISLPAVSPAQAVLSAQLTSSLSSISRLKQSLGVDPLEKGYPETKKLVAEKLHETLQTNP